MLTIAVRPPRMLAFALLAFPPLLLGSPEAAAMCGGNIFATCPPAAKPASVRPDRPATASRRAGARIPRKASGRPPDIR